MKLPTLNFGLVASAVLGFGLIGLSSTPAAAQGTLNPYRQAKPAYGGISCPTGWTRSGDRNFEQCRPSGPNSKPAYMLARPGQCATGYHRSNDFCLEGPAPVVGSNGDRMASLATLRKKDPADRCPIGYFSKSDMSECTTRLVNGPRARFKTGPCNAGEIDEWNLYCTEGTSRITRAQAESEAAGDFNYIYTYNINRLRDAGPNQTPSGDDVANSAPMVAAFGRKPPREDSSETQSATPAAAVAPAAPTGPRVGSLNPQRQTAASPYCPSGWIDGTNPTTGARAEGMCFPMPNLSKPAYPRAAENETCIAGYAMNGTWCGRDPNAPLASSPASAQATTPANCPPAGGAAQQAGAALGSLLGGRRSNSQAGAMLGGLLGAAAAGAAKPAGCP